VLSQRKEKIIEKNELEVKVLPEFVDLIKSAPLVSSKKKVFT
jgi:hypothetical protein